MIGKTGSIEALYHFPAAPGTKASYVADIKILLMVLAALAMPTTLGILFNGLFSMARGKDPARSDTFML